MNDSLPTHTDRPDRLLVIVAHPRDADRALGDIVAGWVAQGTQAWLLCVTSGDGRSDDPDSDPLELAAANERAQRERAAAIGYTTVTFLHRPEGALVNDLALREQLVRHIRSTRPDAVATHDPRVIVSDDGYVNHVDHRECGAAAIDAVSPAAANALAFPSLARSESLGPHRVARLYLFWSDRPTVSVDTVGGGSEALALIDLRA